MDVSFAFLVEETHVRVRASKPQMVKIWHVVSVVRMVSVGARTHRYVLFFDDDSSRDALKESLGSSCPCPTLPPVFNYCDLPLRHLLSPKAWPDSIVTFPVN